MCVASSAAARRGTAVPETHVREAGSGPGVICLHANASHSRQWLGLMESLAPRAHVLAADAYNAGRGPAWSEARPITLADEAALIEPLLDRAEGPVVLVGHSYGAAVALIAALRNPGKVRALALYEPTLFSLLDAVFPTPNAAEGIRSAGAEAAAAVAAGDLDAAARHFIDYWMRPGAWDQTPAHSKPAILAAIQHVAAWGHALFRERTPLSAFRTLDVPVLYMTGQRSTASALAIAPLLAGALPCVKRIRFEGLGHMGPVTHPQIVNDAIAAFLQALPAVQKRAA